MTDRRLSATIACALLLSCAPLAQAADAPWTAKTSVGVTYFQRGDSFTWFVSQGGEAIHHSSDGRYFFFIARRGDLGCDCNIFDLRVFDTAKVKEAVTAGEDLPPPLRTHTVKSRYHKGNEVAGLDQPRLLADNKTIAFLAAEGDAAPQVNLFDVTTGEAKTISQAAHGVVTFDTANGSLVYRGITERKKKTKLKTYPAVFVAPFDMSEIAGFDTEDVYSVVAAYQGGAAATVAPSNFDELFYGYSMSPDGRYAIGSRAVFDQPKAWRAYATPPGGNVPIQYTLIDLKAAAVRPLVDAPTGSAIQIFAYSKALWSPDSRTAIVLNTMLPPGKDPEHANTSYIIAYDVARGTWKILDKLKMGERVLTDIAWNEPGKSIVISRAAGTMASAKTEKKIISIETGAPVEPAPPASSGLVVSVRDELNTPSVIIASHNGKEIRLTPEDPVVAGARRAKVEPVTWTDKSGATWNGGITMPAAKSKGKVPLVVQIYDFEPNRFLPDGIATTAFAMQPLAAQGIAVIQMTMPREIVNEGPPFVEAVDSAVEMAAAKYGIDPARVGLLGFSRSGGRTSYAITHPGRTKLAAALVADGGDANYVSYLNYATIFPGFAKVVQNTLEAVNGGIFWKNKQTWIERSPGFNLERVETPLLVTAPGPFPFLVANEMYSGLRMLNKPVELLAFPEGAHQLMLPRERVASLEATVDWMSFWLTGREDPAKPEQNARWRELRKLQCTNANTLRTFCPKN
jgi:dipeptidyl aminopeptidase/acylaminoacyl peptidase